MNTLPTPPSPGTPIRADLICEMIRAIRRVTPIAGTGVRIASSPNGTVISANPSASVVRYTPTDSCWNIVEGTGTDKGHKVFANRYYQIGGSVYEMTPIQNNHRVSHFVLKGELASGEEYTEDDYPYIFLRINMKEADGQSAGYATLVGAQDFDDVVAVSKDARYYIKPLYLLTHFGGVKIDFRTMPQIASYEISDEEELTA